MEYLIASSMDDAQTFAPTRHVVHGEAATPTFTAMARGPRGEMACSWLSDRGGAQLPFAAIRPPGTDEFQNQLLVYAGKDQKGVCPCCPTAMTFGPDGTLDVGFRNINDGYRDIAIGRL